MEYTPDRWVILELKSDTDRVIKILASWYGGYLGGDSWKLSSGNLSVEDCGEYYTIPQHSGSTYVLPKGAKGMSSMAAGKLAQFRNVEGITINLIESDDIKDWV